MGAWAQPLDQLGADITAFLNGGAGYLEIWNEEHALAEVLNRLPQSDTGDEFRKTVAGSATVKILLARLQVTEEDLSRSDSVLDNIKSIRQRRERTISVCGEVFYCDASNLSELWNHITSQIVDSATTPFDPTPAVLKQPISRSPRRSGPRGGGSAPRPPDWKKELIGLAGEIHAFRSLRSHFGPAMVPASAWVSENSEHCFPGNKGDDNVGYDFRIRVGRNEYFIEVKSTEGDDNLFELGSSEVRSAMELRDRRYAKYLILRVSHALSASPVLETLPNPYDSSSRGLYDLIGSGFRFRYARNV